MLTVITDHWYTLTLPKQKGSQTLYQGARILNNRGLGLVPMARCLSLKYTKLILRPADSRPTLLTRRPYGHFLSSPLISTIPTIPTVGAFWIFCVCVCYSFLTFSSSVIIRLPCSFADSEKDFLRQRHKEVSILARAACLLQKRSASAGHQ